MNRSRPLLPILCSIALGACSDDPAAPAPPTATAVPSATSTPPRPTSTSAPTAGSTATVTRVPAAATPTPTWTAASSSTPTATGTAIAEIGCCGDGVVDEGEECDDGNEVGGDDCAANCTHEHLVSLALSGETVEERPSFDLRLTLASQQTFRVGGATSASGRPSCAGSSRFVAGEIPVAQREADITFEPVSVPGIACACRRPVAVKRCAPPLIRPMGRDCAVAVDCTSGADLCGDPSACHFAHGEGNATSGVIGCAGLDDVDYRSEDVDGGPLTCTRFGGRAPAGAAFLYTSAAVGLIMGNPLCLEDTSNAANGPDGLPCTDDDPATSRGAPETEVFTTGTAGVPVVGPQSILAAESASLPAPLDPTGTPFDCDALPGTPRLCSAVSFATESGEEYGAATTCLEP